MTLIELLQTNDLRGDLKFYNSADCPKLHYLIHFAGLIMITVDNFFYGLNKKSESIRIDSKNCKLIVHSETHADVYFDYYFVPNALEAIKLRIKFAYLRTNENGWYINCILYSKDAQEISMINNVIFMHQVPSNPAPHIRRDIIRLLKLAHKCI